MSRAITGASNNDGLKHDCCSDGPASDSKAQVQECLVIFGNLLGKHSRKAMDGASCNVHFEWKHIPSLQLRFIATKTLAWLEYPHSIAPELLLTCFTPRFHHCSPICLAHVWLSTYLTLPHECLRPWKHHDQLDTHIYICHLRLAADRFAIRSAVFPDLKSLRMVRFAMLPHLNNSAEFHSCQQCHMWRGFLRSVGFSHVCSRPFLRICLNSLLP